MYQSRISLPFHEWTKSNGRIKVLRYKRDGNQEERFLEILSKQWIAVRIRWSPYYRSKLTQGELEFFQQRFRLKSKD